MFINSKGFRMRRDREAKQELGISTEEDRAQQHPERPLGEQSAPTTSESDVRPSLLTRLWRAIAG
jgi:hypothetical protein